MTLSTIADIVRTHGRERPDDQRSRWVTAPSPSASSTARSNQVAAGAGRRRGRRRATGSRSSTRTAPSGSRSPSRPAKLGAVNVSVNWRLAPPEMAQIIDRRPGRGRDRRSRVRRRTSRRSRASSTGVHDDRRHRRPRPLADLRGLDRRSRLADDPGVESVGRRRRLPALHVGHHRAAQGGDAHQRQLLQGRDGHHRAVAVHRGLGEPRHDADVPHRRRRLVAGRACASAAARSCSATSTRPRSCGSSPSTASPTRSWCRR